MCFGADVIACDDHVAMLVDFSIRNLHDLCGFVKDGLASIFCRQWQEIQIFSRGASVKK